MKTKLFIFGALIIILGLGVLAQSPSNLDGSEADAEKILDATDKLRDFAQEGNHSYLFQQWSELLLENKGIATLDSFLIKINFFFFLLLGEDYSFSIGFSVIFLLWVLFFSTTSQAMILFSAFSKWVGYIVALVFSIIVGHLMLYRVIYNLVVSLLSFLTGFWGVIAMFIFIAFIIMGIIFSERIVKAIKKLKVARDYKRRLENTEKRQEGNQEVVKALAGVVHDS